MLALILDPVSRASEIVTAMGVNPLSAMDDDSLADDIQTAPPAGQTDQLPESGMKSAHARLLRRRTKTGCLSESA